MQNPCPKKSLVDSYEFSNCRLNFLSAGGRILFQFNLLTLTLYENGGHLYLSDGNTWISFTGEEAAALGITSSEIDTELSSCTGAGGAGSVSEATISPSLYSVDTNTTVAAGALSVGIALADGVIADVLGTTLYGPITVNWLPMSFGNQRLEYPSMNIYNIYGGDVVISEVR